MGVLHVDARLRGQPRVPDAVAARRAVQAVVLRELLAVHEVLGDLERVTAAEHLDIAVLALILADISQPGLFTGTRRIGIPPLE